MELTQEQIDRQDEVANACYELLVELAPKDSNIPWDMECLGEIINAAQEVICDKMKLMHPSEFYPWVAEDERKPVQKPAEPEDTVLYGICVSDVDNAIEHFKENNEGREIPPGLRDEVLRQIQKWSYDHDEYSLVVLIEELVAQEEEEQMREEARLSGL